MPWTISVDTGGTFTDCFARDPEGESSSLKVLSDGTIRGRLREKVSDVSWRIEQEWEQPDHLFVHGLLANLRTGEQAKILRSRDQGSILELDKKWADAQVGDTIAFSSGEPAPVFAARLATATPCQLPLPPMDFRLGTTKATNALLEKKVARTLFVVNKGLEDLLKIGDQARPDLFALVIRKPDPLTDLVVGVEARMDAQGNELVPVTDQERERLRKLINETQPEAVAISLLHAYRYPEHEQQLAEFIRGLGLRYVSVSHELAPEIKLLPRSLTTVANASLSPILTSYLEEISDVLPDGKLTVMGSAGGLMDHRTFHPKDSLLSGPAGGVIGAAKTGHNHQENQVLSFDMGGTSTDVARCGRRPTLQYETKVGDATLLLPSVAVETVAAGGGSICSFDGQKLQVGPESAGAFPGPACYGAGGPLTVTDVNLLLGYIDEKSFIFPVDRAAAEAAAKTIAAQTSGTFEELLHGFRAIANEAMAGAMRSMAMRQGHEPASHTLVCFGGAGGQHACAVADLLGIKQVVVPKEASILSAWGIAHAAVSRIVNHPILEAWALVEDRLPEIAQVLKTTVSRQLLQEAYEKTEQPDIRYTTILELRLRGQNHSIELEEIEDVPARFQAAYTDTYGHWLPGRELECVNLRVIGEIVAEESEDLFPKESGHDLKPVAFPQSGVIGWQNLDLHQMTTGTGLIVSPHTAVYVEAGWRARRTSQGDIVLSATEQKSGVSRSFFEAELELFSQRFQHIATEMGEMLRRTSLSVNVKERLDFSCAILDPEGQLVANAPHVPVHLGSLGICVRTVLKKLPIGPGDVVITNHPGFGGSHLPDVTLIQGVFDETQTCLGYVANRAHHAEIGGSRPGSTPPFSRNLEEEGVVIAPQYLVRDSIFQEESIRDLLSAGKYPSRSPDENIGDLRAAVAANHAGVSALQQLATESGAMQVREYMKALIQYSDQKMRSVIEQWDWAETSATEYLDDGTVLSVQFKRKADKLSIDFTGTSGVHPQNFNATPAIVYSAVLYVLRLLVGEELPLNEGLLSSVEIHLPEGLLNPVFAADPADCPAVVGGNTETSQRLTDTMLKALGVAACGQGTMNNLLFGNDTFGFYETIGGGSGAVVGHHGADAVHQHMTNTRLTDPELLEHRYPVRLRECAVRQGSGGDGTWSGGDGMIREVEFLADLSVTILSQHRVESPYGLHLGEKGAKGRQLVYWPDGRKEELAGVSGLEVSSGTIIRIETPGGGGATEKS